MSYNRTTHHSERARSVGRRAWEALAGDDWGVVLGVISRGVFVRIARRVVFLTAEGPRGPLTVNLPGLPGGLRGLPAGSPVRIEPGTLFFEEAAVRIVAASSAVWIPPDPPRPAGRADRFGALRALVRAAQTGEEGAGLGRLLNPLLRLPPIPALTPDEQAALQTILELRGLLQRRESGRAAEVAAGLLGMGPGLTPSGDDVVMGLLLAVNRCAAGGWDRGDLDRLNEGIVEAAFQRTTLLSANLIECAAAGEADERLLAPLDAAWGGQAPAPEVVAELLGWGASSGRDALVGMAVALLASG